MNESEIRTVVALERFLVNAGKVSRSEHGPNPPDAIIFVETERWGVEITELHRYYQWKGTYESEAGILQGYADFDRRMQTAVKVPRNRQYSITILGMFPIRPYQDDLIKRIKSFVEPGGIGEFKLDANGFIVIEGFESAGTDGVIKLGVGPHSSTVTADGKAYASNVSANIEFSVDKILQEKTPVLLKMKGYDKRILLLTKVYEFAEPFLVREVFQKKDLNSNVLDSVLMFTPPDDIECIIDPGHVFS